MSTSKNIDTICALVMACAIFITVLFMNGVGVTLAVDTDSENHSDDSFFTENDLTSDWDTSNATVITLEGDGASVTGSGCYMLDGNVVIAKSGKYVVSGNLSGGSLVVNAEDNSKVWILLDNVAIERDDDACLIVDQADKVFLTLAEDSENILTSGSEYSEEALADNTDGAIFSHDDLTINGSGSLTVNAGYKHGIAANDDLVITGGTIAVNAEKDAIHANDSLRITDAVLDIEAGDDGLASDNEGSYVYIESGNITVTCADEGIVSPGDITIAGGNIRISTGTEQGHHGIKAGGTCTVSAGSILIDTCYEGIQAFYIDILGGDITIYATDDGMNASSGGGDEVFGMQGQPGGFGQMPDMAGETEDEDGSFQPMQGHPGGFGQMPDMTGETEGEDGSLQPIQGHPGGFGQMPDMSDESETDGSMGTGESSDVDDNSTSEESEEVPWLHISGGSILILNETGMDSDGLDSNGDIVISGGDIRISLNDSGNNNAIDYGSESGGQCIINGGTVVACGSSAMAESISTDSSQGSVLYYVGEATAEETVVTLTDADGNELLSWTAPYSFSAVVISCPEMTENQIYQIAAGEEKEDVTLNEIAVSAGEAASTMPVGAFPMEGMQNMINP